MSQYYPSAHSVHPSYVPSNSYGRGYRRRNGYGNYYSQMPMQVPSMMQYGQPMAQVPMPVYGNMIQQQPMVGQMPMAYPGYYGYNPYSITNRLRNFFGFAPKHIRYKSSRGTWGFMGYSRRQRYIDPRTGMEVDRQGRLLYRV